jgi:superfamily II DNA or RNA helicase
MRISQSEVIRVRGARWRVLDASGYENCHVLLVTGADPDNVGTRRRFVLPFDEAERIERRQRPVRAPRRLWRRACRLLLATETPPGALTSAREARIDLLPHQLEPALAIVRGFGSRVLLADDVGLGKTVQAGLIVAELQSRGAADRVLIVTPAGLRDQWAHELSERFRILATVLDVRTLRRRSASLPLGMNPWQAVSVAVVSMDYLKRPEVLSAAVACHWDLIIVDEVHGVAGDSERRAALATLARRTPYVVLASATPHNGDRRDFAALCAIGQTDGSNDTLLVFRRSRHDIRFASRRRIHRLHVRMNSDEAMMHALLLRFSRAVRAQHARSRSGRECWLALSVLHKRALSSARSLQSSVARRLAMLARPDLFPSQLPLPLGDPTGELASADEPPAWSPLLALDDAAHERRLLRAVFDVAAKAAKHETKIRALARLLRRIGEPAIVFTEYRDTLQHLRSSLGLPCLTLHGGMRRDERAATIDEFSAGRARLLLATDAAAEGLNLQRSCRLIVNLELPWNPMRLEQRIGRVDRIGQRRAVHVFHLIARDSAERGILARLQARVATVQIDIGGADPLSSEPPDGASSSASFQSPTLAPDARQETERNMMARRLVRDGDADASVPLQSGPLIARSRHRRTRAGLAGRTVRLWRLCAEDGSGRSIGAINVAIAAERGVRPVDGYGLENVNRAVAEWKGRVSSVQHAFAAARLARELAIQDARRSDSARSPLVSQAGLFDCRLERARLAVAAADEAAAQDEADRITLIERSRVIVFPPPQLHLVLTP